MDTLQQILSPELYDDVMEMYKSFSMGDVNKASKVQVYRGHIFAPHFSPEAVEFAFDSWSMKEGDVMLASYPKTGTNWMLTILRTLLCDEKELSLCKQLPTNVTLLEAGGSKKFSVIDRLPLRRRVIGTHVPGDLINMEMMKKANAKVVYILRNPKDQIVSMYHFAQKLLHGSGGNPMSKYFSGGWESYFDHVIQGKVPNSSLPGEWYPHHILSWYKHRDNKTVCFVYYEDLKKDFKNELRRIAEFLNVDVSDEKIVEIEGRCSIDGMKKDIGSYSKDVGIFQSANLRKGEVGGWKNYFTVAQSELVDLKMKECLQNTDVHFKYT